MQQIKSVTASFVRHFSGLAPNGEKKRGARWMLERLGSENEKACRGRRCGRLFENNEQQLGGGVLLLHQTPLGRRSGPSETEALREEEHRFVEIEDSLFFSLENRLCCSADMQK